jgi:hypothetical protein
MAAPSLRSRPREAFSGRSGRDDLARFRGLYPPRSPLKAAVADSWTYFLVACMKACISSGVSLPSLLLSIALKIRSWAA